MKAGVALATAAASLLLAAGCTTVGPDYQRPVVVLPPAFPIAGAPVDEAPIAADWWTLFGSEELNRLQLRALSANTDIAQAVARVEQAEALAREAAGARLPSLDLQSGASRGRQIGVTGNIVTVALSAAFELDFWGRLRRADEAARAQLLASQASRDTVRLSVAAIVAQAFFTLHALDEQIVATQSTLVTRERGLKLTRARLEAGTTSRLDAEQAEILRAESALLLHELRRQRALALSQLGVLTADPALDLPTAVLPPTAQAPLPPPGLPSALLERRPDVRSAEEQLRAANAQIGVARAALFPTISLTGSLGNESGDLAQVLQSATRFWSLGLGLALPLFDGGRRAARVDQAGAAQRAAVASYQGSVYAAFKDVSDALANVRAARDAASDAQARFDAADRALKLARARFDAGYTSTFEVLDSERTAVSAQLDVVRNRQAQLSASVALIQALGGGWTGVQNGR